MRHRGPDGRGEWISPDGRVWLGHTRLAIVDLSPTGAQPMHDPENGNVITFNGEIYNHGTLREEMRGAGVKWLGTSDTETLLVAYRLWGDRMLERLKGMFAFIIFDAATGRLFCARGPAGIKPLYYVRTSGMIRFASEVRPLLAGAVSTPDERSISSYLQWGTCPENQFILPAIKMVPGGYWMSVRPDTSVETGCYWPGKAYPPVSSAGAPARVRKLVEKSVEEHLMADVPVATFLSGGIDSSVITAVAARALGAGKLRTFSVGFMEEGFDESDVATEVAQRFDTEHLRIELGAGEIIQLVQEAVTRMDAPSVDAINTYIVSKKVAEQGIKVALSGLGGDELFGGYPSFREAPILARIAAIPASIRRIFSKWGKIGARIADLPSGADIYQVAIWRRRFWTDAKLRRAGLPLNSLHAPQPPELVDDFARISWAEMGIYMRQMLLRDSDQMSMAVSLELRVPFLDRDLIDYTLSLPAHEKTRYRIPKGLLVEAFRDLLPERVYNRPKMGFALPIDQWMRGPLRSFSDTGLDEMDRLAVLAPGSIAWIRRQFEDRKIHWTRIWSLVVLGHYLKNLGFGAGPGISAATKAA